MTNQYRTREANFFQKKLAHRHLLLYGTCDQPECLAKEKGFEEHCAGNNSQLCHLQGKEERSFIQETAKTRIKVKTQKETEENFT